MPNDRRQNDVLNAVQAGGPDFGKFGKFPHGNDARADDLNGQMEKPMQIAEPRVQQEEDQVSRYLFCILCCLKLRSGCLLNKLGFFKKRALFFINSLFCIV